MSAHIIRFPAKRTAAVFVMPAREGGWYVLARQHGRLHGDMRSASRDARWLAANLGFPIRTGKQKMRTYDNRNRGALFRDDNKTKDTDRDYSGTLDVDGTEFWISGWIKTSKKGTKFLSLSVKPKTETAEAKPAHDDLIPF